MTSVVGASSALCAWGTRTDQSGEQERGPQSVPQNGPSSGGGLGESVTSRGHGPDNFEAGKIAKSAPQ